MKYYVEQIEKTVDIDTNGCYIGVDFGTTNSTLSYLGIKETSQSNVRVETIAYRESVEQTEYIPTVVTYNNKDKSYAIGRSAKITLANVIWKVMIVLNYNLDRILRNH